MGDVSAYWATIKEETERLRKLYPDGVWMISVRNMQAGSTAGCVSHVSVKIAAKHLVENTARVATPEEVADFQARSKAASERLQAQAYTNHKRHDSSGVVHFVREK